MLKFKRTLIASAVMSTLVATSAQAVDLTAVAPAGLIFASENTISAVAPGTTLTNAGSALDVTAAAGFSISDGTERYMRFDLTGATFAVAAVTGDLTVADTGAGALEVLSTGGGVGQSFVVYEVIASGTNVVNIASTAVLATPNLNVTSQGAVTVEYRLYADPTDAVAGNSTTLASDSGPLLSFSPAVAVSSTPITPQLIDVATGSTKFAAVTNASLAINTLGNITLVETAARELIDGATDVTAATSRSASTLTVTGDFTAAQDAPGGAPDGTYTVGNVYIDTSDLLCDSVDIPATTLTDTTAVFATGNGAIAATAGALCIITNGVSIIPEQTFTSVYAPTAASAAFTVSDVTAGLATHDKNGDTVDLDLVLTPGGMFSNYIRVNNKTSIAGDVLFTLWNDAGDSVSFALGDIAGVASNELGGQSSTALLDVNALYTAAQAADATFDVSGGKLRARIDGEFATIEAQAVTVSTDNTTFSTF